MTGYLRNKAYGNSPNILFFDSIPPYRAYPLFRPGHSPSISDSLALRSFPRHVDHFFDRKGVQLVTAPVILFGLAGIASLHEQDIRDIRNRYIPRFNLRYDDYLQYAPGATVLALKLAGVKGYSSWGRFLVSGAFSTLLLEGTVLSLKNGISKRRPDGGNDHSFPSGHTAVAFMMATWLHKEYGLTRSPLYSILGYTSAAMTGFGRQLNNRHWLSDVLAGAGIGILSANLGYFLSDLIFKEKGISDLSSWEGLPPFGAPPSFWNMTIGFSILNNELHYEQAIDLQTRNGVSIGTEGAWFFNTFLGIGGAVNIRTNALEINGSRFFEQHPELEDANIVESRGQGAVQFLAGPYFSYPISKRWLLGGKLLMGHSSLSDASVQGVTPEGQEVTFFKSRGLHRWNWQTGVSLSFIVNRNMGVRIFTDYTGALRRPACLIYDKGGISDPTYLHFRTTRRYLNTLYVGGSICAWFF